jgi:hypothetical protein
VIRWRIVLTIYSLLICGFLVVAYQSESPHSWVYRVWGEGHIGNDMVTMLAGIAAALIFGSELWRKDHLPGPRRKV